MINLQRILAITVARNREFLRDRAALTWSIAFPLLVIGGFSVAFRTNEQNLYKIAVVAADNSGAGIRSASGEPETATGANTSLTQGMQEFIKLKHLDIVWTADEPQATEALRHHKYDLVLRHDGVYWVNNDSPKGYFLEKLLIAIAAPTVTNDGPALERRSLSGKAIRYIDWLVSGLIGMNMMFSAMFGVGYVIVRYRKNGFLKRLKATPLQPLEFLSGQMLSRLLVTSAISILVFVTTNALFGFRMEGTYLHLFLTMVMGSTAMISLGLVVVSTIRSEELANGVLNLLTWPMMFLSGVWFSLEGAHPTIRHVASILPLTHFIDASRSIMLDGAGWTGIRTHLAILGGCTTVCLTIAALTFSWDSDQR